MPQVYRRHSEYSQRTSSEPRRRSSLAPQATNADDSIVLSDLVRTGEASRLRRRGAMRIDHAGIPPRPAPSVIPTIPEPRPSTWGRVPDGWRAPTPPWSTTDPNGLEDEYINPTGEWRDYAEDSRPNISFGDPSGGVTIQTDEASRNNNSNAPEDEGPFVLYCGGEEEEQPEFVPSSTGPFEPSLFPLFRSSPASQSTRATTQTTRKTNGCGAIVHMRAFPQRSRGVWVGKEEASEVVVGLDASYFERSVVVKMMRSSCGCIREGIGCAVWYVHINEIVLSHVHAIGFSTVVEIHWARDIYRAKLCPTASSLNLAALLPPVHPNLFTHQALATGTVVRIATLAQHRLRLTGHPPQVLLPRAPPQSSTSTPSSPTTCPHLVPVRSPLSSNSSRPASFSRRRRTMAADLIPLPPLPLRRLRVEA